MDEDAGVLIKTGRIGVEAGEMDVQLMDRSLELTPIGSFADDHQRYIRKLPHRLQDELDSFVFLQPAHEKKLRPFVDRESVPEGRRRLNPIVDDSNFVTGENASGNPTHRFGNTDHLRC